MMDGEDGIQSFPPEAWSIDGHHASPTRRGRGTTGSNSRKYAITFALLFFFAIASLAMYLAGRKRTSPLLDSSSRGEPVSYEIGIHEAITMSTVEATAAPVTPGSNGYASDLSDEDGLYYRVTSNPATPASPNFILVTQRPPQQFATPTTEMEEQYRPTSKPTHKRHTHSNYNPGQSTSKPTHKRHTHSEHVPGTPSFKPTHRRHNHDTQGVPTSKPTHKRHDHSDRVPTARTTARPTPWPTQWPTRKEEQFI